MGKDGRAAQIVGRALAEGEGTTVATGLDGTRRLYAYTRVAEAGWVVYAGIPTDVAFADANANELRGGLAALASVLLAGVFALYAGGSLQRSVKRLAAAVRAVGSGQLDVRAPVEGPSEIAEVAESFNEMVDARSRAEASVREANEKLHALIEASPLSILALDLDGNVTMWNPASQRLFGWGEAEVVGRPLPTVPSGGREEFELTRGDVLAGGGAVGLQTIRQRKDGSLVDVELAFAPLHAPDGAVSGHVTVIADITDRKRAEAERRRYAERLAGLHEIDQAILAAGSPDEIIRAALSGLKRLVLYNRASVVRLDDERREVRFLAVDEDRPYGPPAGTTLPVTAFGEEGILMDSVRYV